MPTCSGEPICKSEEREIKMYKVPPNLLTNNQSKSVKGKLRSFFSRTKSTETVRKTEEKEEHKKSTKKRQKKRRGSRAISESREFLMSSKERKLNNEEEQEEEEQH